MSFHEALQIVLQNEGGYLSRDEADRVGDPGGATNYGITEVTLKRLGIPKRPEDLNALEAREIYRVSYWVPVSNLEYHSKGLALAAFDFGVQSGPGTAIRKLQRVVGAKADGVMGPQTGKAIEQFGVVPAILDLSAARRRLLLGWALSRPRRLVLLRGVMARVDRVARLSVQWAIDERPSQPADVLWRGFHRVPHGR